MKTEDDLKQDLEFIAWLDFFEVYYDEDDAADLAGVMINKKIPFIPSRVLIETSTRSEARSSGITYYHKIGFSFYDKINDETPWLGFHWKGTSPIFDMQIFSRLKEKIMRYGN